MGLKKWTEREIKSGRGLPQSRRFASQAARSVRKPFGPRQSSAAFYSEGHDAAENAGEISGGELGLALQTEHGGNFRGRGQERENELGVIERLLGGHEDVEVQREILVGGIGNDADGGAGNFMRAANRAD